jgi:(p)ppGpp synthase/HD superfamily hydrolase
LHEAVEAAIASQTVASIVVEVTDDKSLPKAETQAMQVESPGHKSREAKLIKLADKTSNIRAISFSQRRIGRSNVD